MPTSDTDPVISLWFKTTSPDGVLASMQEQAVSPGTTVSADYTPVLYSGNDGRLCAEWYTGSSADAIISSAPVDSGEWHHVVLATTGSGSSTTQTLYIDGTSQGSLTGAIDYPFSPTNLTFGTGYIGASWPDEANQGKTTASLLYFDGDLADITLG